MRRVLAPLAQRANNETLFRNILAVASRRVDNGVSKMYRRGLLMHALKLFIGKTCSTLMWLMAVGVASAATITVVPAGTGSGVITSSAGSINCGAVCGASLANGTALTLTATPGSGQRFMGWLGPCSNDTACNFIVNGDATAIATFAPIIVGAPTLDIDGSSSCGALTDGLLLMRYMLGLPTAASTIATSALSALRISTQDLGDYLLNVRPALDIDGNGQADAATDGVLILRYLFGLRGSTLTAGPVFGIGATRQSASAIEARISDLCATFPPSYLLAASKSGAGTGSITSGSNSPGIACGSDCSQNYIAGASVALTATPAAGSFFAGWGGACTGTGACNVSMTAANSVSAVFTQVAPGCTPSVDVPDINATDSNCDGVDGDIATSFFVSKLGADTNPGTIGAPFLTVQKGVDSASVDATRKSVLISSGVYDEGGGAGLQAKTGVSLYGAYDPNWQRSAAWVNTTQIRGSPQGVLADGVTNVTLQLLSVVGVAGAAPGSSVYGVRAINGADITLASVAVTVPSGVPGSTGAAGAPGANAAAGNNGSGGSCDAGEGFGGAGGAGTPLRYGGQGGNGGPESGASSGQSGYVGTGGTPGGAGGARGNPGAPGSNGTNGANGAVGSLGAGGTNTLANAAVVWSGANGTIGGVGAPGNGGGGGGGGGSQFCSFPSFCNAGGGNGGGGAGGGGGGGAAGPGGTYGGGSFAVYLFNATATVNAGTLTTGKGGKGGDGGAGGVVGQGGASGLGAFVCTSEIGSGGNGGTGGSGGAGGNGGGAAGGPSIGVFRVGTSTVTVLNSPSFILGTPGGGGAGGGATGVSGSIIQQ